MCYVKGQREMNTGNIRGRKGAHLDKSRYGLEVINNSHVDRWPAARMQVWTLLILSKTPKPEGAKYTSFVIACYLAASFNIDYHTGTARWRLDSDASHDRRGVESVRGWNNTTGWDNRREGHRPNWQMNIIETISQGFSSLGSPQTHTNYRIELLILYSWYIN